MLTLTSRLNTQLCFDAQPANISPCQNLDISLNWRLVLCELLFRCYQSSLFALLFPPKIGSCLFENTMQIEYKLTTGSLCQLTCQKIKCWFIFNNVKTKWSDVKFSRLKIVCTHPIATKSYRKTCYSCIVCSSEKIHAK